MTYLLFLFFLNNSNAATPARALDNNKSASLIEKDQTLEAQSRLQRSVVNHNNYGELHYNLALSYEKNGDNEKAVKEYQVAAQLAETDNLKFQSNFNAGRLLGDMKQIPQALASYQAALETKPDSTETKTNIELLTKEDGGGGQNQKQDKDQKQGDKNEDKKEQSQNQKQNQEQKNQQSEKKNNKAPEYKPENLSKQDVQKIFEELKRQEDKIRAKVSEDKKKKDTGIEKDW